ncbi:MAG TPA: hydrogenase maturation protease [Bryobacteraceae bacterium]|jgi:hydrogenase maturation protease|nr:hydrogenase maturation protease [Bryobacteraceae bacterium]
MSILIAGIGNIFLGDDAFGVEVAQRLAERPWPEGVRAVDFGIRGFDLAFALLDGVDLTIFVDATPRGGEPGTLYLIEPDTRDITAEIDGHSMNPLAVLQLVKTMGGEIRRLLIVGCEPESCGEGIGLSPRVAASVDRAVEMIEEVVARALVPALVTESRL